MTRALDAGRYAIKVKRPIQHPRQWTRLQQKKALVRIVRTAYLWRDNWRHA